MNFEIFLKVKVFTHTSGRPTLYINLDTMQRKTASVSVQLTSLQATLNSVNNKPVFHYESSSLQYLHFSDKDITIIQSDTNGLIIQCGITCHDVDVSLCLLSLSITYQMNPLRNLGSSGLRLFLFNNTRFSGNINQTLRKVAVPGQVNANFYDKKHPSIVLLNC